MQEPDRAPHDQAISPADWLKGLPARGVIGLVRAYQRFLSPVFGGQCRFHPSCSQYFILAVEKYGVISGSLRGVWRILKCQPFHPGGYDPP
jgi:putative membrane protein insertion efficiency factor